MIQSTTNRPTMTTTPAAANETPLEKRRREAAEYADTCVWTPLSPDADPRKGYECMTPKMLDAFLAGEHVTPYTVTPTSCNCMAHRRKEQTMCRHLLGLQERFLKPLQAQERAEVEAATMPKPREISAREYAADWGA